VILLLNTTLIADPMLLMTILLINWSAEFPDVPVLEKSANNLFYTKSTYGKSKSVERCKHVKSRVTTVYFRLGRL
jgi:hypothetical protein